MNAREELRSVLAERVRSALHTSGSLVGLATLEQFERLVVNRIVRLGQLAGTQRRGLLRIRGSADGSTALGCTSTVGATPSSTMDLPSGVE